MIGFRWTGTGTPTVLAEIKLSTDVRVDKRTYIGSHQQGDRSHTRASRDECDTKRNFALGQRASKSADSVRDTQCWGSSDFFLKLDED